MAPRWPIMAPMQLQAGPKRPQVTPRMTHLVVKWRFPFLVLKGFCFGLLLAPFGLFLGSFGAWRLWGASWPLLGAPLGALRGAPGLSDGPTEPKKPSLGPLRRVWGAKNIEKPLCFLMILTVCLFHYRIRFGGVREGSRGTPDEARSLQEALQEGQEAPDGTQEGPKRAPRGPQEGLQRGPQRVPKRDSDPTWLGDPSGTPPGRLRDPSGVPFWDELGPQTSPI